MHLQQFILNTLDDLFPNPSPSLIGWSTPYQFLIAVLLSGNSTDKAVNAILPNLFTVAPTAEAMVQLEPKALLALIAPCGLGPRKSQYIHQLSALLVRDFQGEPPPSLELLTSLPGVGRKTASVFLSVLYQQPTFPVDTHILRLAQRWGISQKKTPSAVEKDLVQFFTPHISSKLHLQLIYYARSFCPAVRHQLAQCAICSFVQSQKNTSKNP